MVETPELDRVAQLRSDGVTPTLENFYDWVHEQGLRLMRWSEVIDDRECITCNRTGKRQVKNEDPMAGWSSSVPEMVDVACDGCGGKGYNQVVTGHEWMEDPRRPEVLFAEHLGINLDEVERERRELLEAQRRLNAEVHQQAG